MIRFYRRIKKILRKFRMKSNEFDQITNYQFDKRHNQQFQFFNVQMFREVDRKHEFFATKFKKSIFEIILSARKHHTNDSKSFNIDD